jgi:TetR/AcrR family transcriptional regulator
MFMEQDSKDKLRDAATVLFADHGYGGVSIRQIADAAGMNSALISYYFGSKQGLYEAVVEKQVRIIDKLLYQDMDVLDPREVIRQYADVMKQVHKASPVLLKFICRELANPSEVMGFVRQRIAPPLFAIMSKTLQRGMEQGLFRPDLEIRPTVILLVGMINFYYLSHQLQLQAIGPEKERENEDTYMKQAVEIFLQGIERR